MKKKHTKRTKFFLLLIMCSLITSCVTRKQAQFFQDRKNIEGQIVRDENNIKIKPDDRLTIMVLSPNQEAARPFNPRLINAGGGGGGAGNQTVEYIVSNEGDIEFPVLGRIHVAGLTVIQLARYLEEQISPYLNDPLVNVNIANFYITFLGEVNQTINIPGDHINLNQALGMVGGIPPTGKIDNVLIIREVGGKRTYQTLNMKNSDIMESEFFDLQQDDVVYIEPTPQGRQRRGYLGTISNYIGLVSSAISLIFIFTR